MSPDDSVKDVVPEWWHSMSCTWNIILSSASSCVKLSRGNGEAHSADTFQACGDIGKDPADPCGDNGFPEILC